MLVKVEDEIRVYGFGLEFQTRDMSVTLSPTKECIRWLEPAHQNPRQSILVRPAPFRCV